MQARNVWPDGTGLTSGSGAGAWVLAGARSLMVHGPEDYVRTLRAVREEAAEAGRLMAPQQRGVR